jgi:predicted dinucleotide-binding enzyme
VGKRPLVLKADTAGEMGDIVLAAEQWSLLRKVMADPRHQLAGGIIVTTH